VDESIEQFQGFVNSSSIHDEGIEECGEADESNDTVQTVQVDGDPCHICLSATHVDASLIDYLQMHPTTKRLVSRPILQGISQSNEELVLFSLADSALLMPCSTTRWG